MKKVYERYVDDLNDQEYYNNFRIQKKNAPFFKVNHGDILKIDWSEADFILANSTCFSQELMEGISKAAKKCKKGSWLLTLTKKLPDSDWDCVLSIKLKMSWGDATIHIHKKISEA